MQDLMLSINFVKNDTARFRPMATSPHRFRPHLEFASRLQWIEERDINMFCEVASMWGRTRHGAKPVDTV